jgi:hypothetical protein
LTPEAIKSAAKKHTKARETESQWSRPKQQERKREGSQERRRDNQENGGTERTTQERGPELCRN